MPGKVVSEVAKTGLPKVRHWSSISLQNALMLKKYAICSSMVSLSSFCSFGPDLIQPYSFQ